MPSRIRSAWLALLVALLTAAAIPLATPVAGAEGAPNSLGLDATYDVSATLRWEAGKLIVSSAATITNSTDEDVPGFTFNLVPAKIGQIVLNPVLVDGQAAVATRDDQNIIVDLAQPLPPGGETVVTISYKATFATKNTGKRYLFQKKGGVATAYRWIPWLSKRYAFKTAASGEPLVTQASRMVTVKLTSDNPNMKFATTGQLVASEGGVQEFEAHNVRDFNFAASPYYQVVTETHGGVQFDFYTTELSPTSLSKVALSSFDRYTSLVGPYPYPRLAVAETANGEAMESPGLIWIPRNRSRADRRFLVRHEVAHQWFYAVAGNDQATEPFADEALAEFLTRTIMGFRPSSCAEGALDRTLYQFGERCYYEALYVQGASYLNDYRQRVGDEAFWAGMRAYYERYTFRIGGTLELLNTLDEFAPEGTGGGHETRFPSLFPPPG